ncbi:MAG: hypothetical protein JXA97_08205 [Anaerolineales bacterium]|nr:hypothetical protein [Anaerolineales bacterium]
MISRQIKPLLFVLLAVMMTSCGPGETESPTDTTAEAEAPPSSLSEPAGHLCILFEDDASSAYQLMVYQQLDMIFRPWMMSESENPEQIAREILGHEPEVLLEYTPFGPDSDTDCDYILDYSELEVFPDEESYVDSAGFVTTCYTGCTVEGTISLTLPTGEIHSVDIPRAVDEVEDQFNAENAPEDAQEAPCGYLWLKPLLHMMADVWGEALLVERSQVLGPLLEGHGYWWVDPTRPFPAQDTDDSFLDVLNEVLSER